MFIRYRLFSKIMRERFYSVSFRPRRTRRQYHDLSCKGQGRVKYQVNGELAGFCKGDIVRVKGRQPSGKSDLNVMDRDKTLDVETQSGPSTDATVTASTVVWTPRFIVLFAAIFTLGSSVASILTQVWLNGFLSAEAIQLFYTAFVLGSSLFIIVKLENMWMRAGGIFACIWCLLMSLHFALPAVSELDPHTSLVAHLDIATQCAFLGAATCFSISSTPFRRWDIWFFYLLPIVGAAIIGLNVLLAPTDLPTGNFNESMIVTALSYLSVLIWWCRPANWSVQPDVTFLAGTIPVLQILFTGSGYHASDVAFFMTLVVLLFFFLLNLRLLHGEGRLFQVGAAPTRSRAGSK